MRYAITCAALFFSSVLATPAPLKLLAARDPDTTNNIPNGDKVCNGNTYSPADIKTAVNFAWQAKKDGKTYKWDKKNVKAVYPHRNTPDQGNMKWSDFNLPGCSQGEDSSKADFQEYPIITGGSAWQGGSVSQGSDRIVFQDIDSTTAAFCGIITHTTNDNGRPTGKFRLCDDPAGSAAVPPYAPGTCSLHATQWDLESTRSPPRYDVEITMFDNAKTQIGYQPRTGSDGSYPVYVSSALEDDLVVTAESQNDYIKYTLGAQTWPSNGKFGPTDAHNSCSVGDWDCSDFPCYRQMDCSYGCAWHGGESSANAEGDDD